MWVTCREKGGGGGHSKSWESAQDHTVLLPTVCARRGRTRAQQVAGDVCYAEYQQEGLHVEAVQEDAARRGSVLTRPLTHTVKMTTAQCCPPPPPQPPCDRPTGHRRWRPGKASEPQAGSGRRADFTGPAEALDRAVLENVLKTATAEHSLTRARVAWRPLHAPECAQRRGTGHACVG